MKSPLSYAGFTIGPIYDVLSHARKTRELWFGSYFFSWFMEELISRLSDKAEVEFLSPHVIRDDSGRFIPNRSMAGKYHDRFVIRAALERSELYRAIKDATEEVLDFFIELTNNLIGSTYMSGKGKGDVKKILENYIQRNFAVLEPSAVNVLKPVGSVDEYLNAMEEWRIFSPGCVKDTCSRCRTLEGVVIKKLTEVENNEKAERKRTLCPLCFLKLFCHKSTDVKKKVNLSTLKYPSTLELAAQDLLANDVVLRKLSELIEERDADDTGDRDYEFEDILEAIRKIDDPKVKEHIEGSVRLYHKYFAVVSSDGDDLGRLAGNLQAPKKLSGRLFSFAEQAESIIRKYKGEPVYIGGDDILAFMPVAVKDDGGEVKTIFDLVTELSDVYKSVVNGGAETGSTLSVGVNISYYKFPLSMAIEGSRTLLHQAKRSGKNALAVGLTRHSGHRTEVVFRFGEEEVASFREIVDGVLSGTLDIQHSVHHNLARFRAVISNLSDEVRLEAFFGNNFNEPGHARYRRGLDRVREFLGKSVLCLGSAEDRLKKIDDILGKLYLVNYLRSKA